MVNDNQTICALATPNGSGAIGVVRVSGKNALDLVTKSFSKSLENLTSHTSHFGVFKDANGAIIDEVLLTYFENGKSFTGEESVEISCHGSTFIQQEILSVLTSNGFRMAEPGEFTKRAFMNGKLDLSQAEAVADLIVAWKAGPASVTPRCNG